MYKRQALRADDLKAAATTRWTKATTATQTYIRQRAEYLGSTTGPHPAGAGMPTKGHSPQLDPFHKLFNEAEVPARHTRGDSSRHDLTENGYGGHGTFDDLGHGGYPNAPEYVEHRLENGDVHYATASRDQAARSGTHFRALMRARMNEKGWTEAQVARALDTPPHKLSKIDRHMLADLRNQIPNPDRGTLLSKAMPTEDADIFLENKKDWVVTARGFVARATDTADMHTTQDIFERLALDYHPGEGGVNRYRAPGQNEIPPMGGATARDEIFVMRFLSDDSDILQTPRDKTYGNAVDPDQVEAWTKAARDDGDPFVGSGFSEGFRGVPEWTTPGGASMEMRPGAEMWRVTADGQEQLAGVLRRDADSGALRWVRVVQ